MYYYYMVLARFFRYNLVSKAGDAVDVHSHHKNLLYYCEPRCLRKINVCDFIYNEIQRSIEKRMTPNFCQYVQRLIDATIPAAALPKGACEDMEDFTLPRRGSHVDLPQMLPSERRTKHAHDPLSASGSRSRRDLPRALPRKKGLALFFNNLWDMCRSSYDVAHRSLELSQENRRQNNAFLAERGRPVPDLGNALAPVPYVNFEKPPLDEDMFWGFDPSMFPGFATSSSSQRRATTTGDDDDDDDGEGKDEEEGDDEEEEEEEAYDDDDEDNFGG